MLIVLGVLWLRWEAFQIECVSRRVGRLGWSMHWCSRRLLVCIPLLYCIRLLHFQSNYIVFSVALLLNKNILLTKEISDFEILFN